MRHLLSAFVAICLVPGSVVSTLAAELEVGSKAPAINVKHWIQDGKGFFKPVTKFEPGKVYVIEFWATWCRPCLASMPHLAKLQTKYRDKKVQIISISDESIEDVKKLLGRKHTGEGKTYGELTSAYCLSTDPDRSVHVDYFEASDQLGLPASFIVGKTGHVEWIGQPMDLDDPLEAVVNDKWDRAAVVEEVRQQKLLEQTMEKISDLLDQEKHADALKLVETNLKAAKSTAQREQWASILNDLKLASGIIDDGVVAYYKSKLKDADGSSLEIAQLAYSISVSAQQGADISKLAEPALAALSVELKRAPDNLKPLIYNTQARLYDANKQFKRAVAAQESAVELATDRMKRRLTPYLEELREKLEAKDGDR